MKRWILFMTAPLTALALPAYAEEAPSQAPAAATADTASVDAEAHRSDPWEPANRRLYAVGQFLDHVAFRPIALAYDHVVPKIVRKGVKNALTNLSEPGVAVNDLLQGKPKSAGASAVRFALNTTVGCVGVIDVAKSAGVEHHDNDAGITLAKYKMAAGPYLFVPLAGPSSVRDVIGMGADFVLDPIGWAQFKGAGAVAGSQMALTAVDARAEAEPELQQLKTVAADPYATLRAYYLQARASEAGAPVEMADMPDIPDIGDGTMVADANAPAEPVVAVAPSPAEPDAAPALQTVADAAPPPVFDADPMVYGGAGGVF